MKRATYLLLAACCSLLTAHAEPPALRWIVDPSRPAPADWVVFQGETVTLEPSFVAYGATLPLTNCTAALYWQTNGMGQAWWSVPAEIVTSAAPRVRATWSPTNDAGARAYTYFVGLVAPGGIGYRAHGRLMMRAAPGAIPALLGPPTTLTDAMQAWADARYDPLGAAQGVSNTLAGALQSEAQARVAGDSVAPTAAIAAWAPTGIVARTGLATSWVEIAAGAPHHVTLHCWTTNWIVTARVQDADVPPALGDLFLRASDTTWTNAWGSIVSAPELGASSVAEVWYPGTGSMSTTALFTCSVDPEGDEPASFVVTMHTGWAITNRVPIAIETNTVTPAQLATATNILSGDIAAGNIPMRRMQMWDWGWSTNRWLVLTNDYIEIWEK